MKILISNTSDSPLYQQIKDQIKDAILKEELVEGDALPSIRAFANDLKVSVLTIRRVYEELEQGLLQVRSASTAWYLPARLEITAGFQTASCRTENARYDTNCEITENN